MQYRIGTKARLGSQACTESSCHSPLKSSVMGYIPSSSSKPWAGICVTLDAFGTLYHPKKPVAVQYLEIARRCGLKADIKVPELEASFRKEFKNQSARHPNYGKAGGIMTVESWWNNVVYGAFRPLCRGDHIPDSLGPTLFRHFSSREAYALYPDVVPFLKSVRKLREKYTDPKGPMMAIGVITNSDDRALNILESLGLKVASERELSRTFDGWKRLLSEPVEIRRPERRYPFSGASVYNPTDDIDFLVTSYETGYEKPDSRIFDEADWRTFTLWPSRWEQSSQPILTGSDFVSRTFGLLWKRVGITRVHVGDDLEKDYQGAKDTNRQALHLRRKKEDGLKDHQISNLLELATFINVIVDANSAAAAAYDKGKP